MRRFTCGFCGGAALWLALAAPARAQTVLRVNDLSFPVTIAGTPLTVTPGDATAAKFQITTPKKTTSLQVIISLPATLSGPGALPVTFGPASAAWSTKDRATGATSFDPGQGLVIPTGNRSLTVYVWIGGTIQPPASQPTGDYTGIINLSASSQ